MITNSVNFFKKQSVEPLSESYKLIVASWKISNPNNMGHIIRMGHNLGAERVLFIDDKIQKRESKIRKTAGFSFEQQSWEIINEEKFSSVISGGYRFVVLETCENSKNIYEVELPEKMILLGGNESHGLPENIINKSELQIYIPMPGGCKSMNISHALGVASFEWYRQTLRNNCFLPKL
ncbi:hypothetical protein GM418_14380 [Maribellus comscasis]|uniref:tRNA/rRNA methyltransferase SpoU type domain-containing protein n=1 Tax=Maribellus comscasis TaxID=2681766 RepID=A0A6I6JUQ7_9BACT|nr:TrmH family RNA methyltransferase [Maribellus comscasis]QGY44810.1 hypothetical protein GM418_14380 [Maribellus comscasis]